MKTRLQIEAFGGTPEDKATAIAHVKQFLENAGWEVESASDYPGAEPDLDVLLAQKRVS